MSSSYVDNKNSVYCNGFDQRVARQQPRKHLPTGATQQWRNLRFLYDDVINNRDVFSAGSVQSSYKRSEFKVTAHHWKFSKVYTSPRFAHSFQPSVCI
jgi:hypothetical protein